MKNNKYNISLDKYDYEFLDDVDKIEIEDGVRVIPILL